MSNENESQAPAAQPPAADATKKSFRKKSANKDAPLGATPSAAQLKGVVSGYSIAVWGTSGAGTVTEGVILRCRVAKKADKEPLPDEEGFTIGMVFFNHSDEVEVEVIAKDAAALPEQGASFTAATITGLVMDAELVWEYRGLKKMKVMLTRFANMTLA